LELLQVNHIQHLTEQRDEALAAKAEAIRLLCELEAYLLSPKFYDDTTVQIADVLRRLAPVRYALL
jgi:hypothetical protein